MKLNNKCIKIIDSDITEDTYWSKSFIYIIVKIIKVTEGVLLKIEDGTKIYLVDGYYDNPDKRWFGSLSFKSARLCAQNLHIGSVTYDGKNFYVNNSFKAFRGGVSFNGTKIINQSRQERVTQALKHSKVYSNLTDEQQKKYREMKENCICTSDKNTSNCFYRFNSITSSYIGDLSFWDLKENEFCGKTIKFYNVNEYPYFDNANVSVCNFIYKVCGFNRELENAIVLVNSVLKIKNYLNVIGVDYLFYFIGISKAIFAKKSKLNILACNLYGSSSNLMVNITPEDSLKYKEKPFTLNSRICKTISIYSEEK